MEIVSEMLLNIFGVLTGGLITLLAARKYYEKASIELVKESAELKRVNVLMLSTMEHAGVAEFAKNEDGDFKGLLLKLKVDDLVVSTAIDNVTLTPGKPK